MKLFARRPGAGPLWLRPPQPTRQSFALLLCLMLAFSLLRVLFLAMYWQRADDPGWLLISRSFLIGLRFDFVSSAMLLAPFVLLQHLPFAASRPRLLHRLFLPLLILVGVVASLTVLGDCIYYASSSKRISYEPMVLFEIGGEVMQFAFEDRPVLLPATIAAILAFWVVVWAWLQRKLAPREQDLGWVRCRSAVFGLLLLAFLFGSLRVNFFGSLLRIGHAYFSTDVLVNHATLNPIYTFITCSVDDRRLYRLMPDDEALETVRQSLEGDGHQATYLSQDYPLARAVAGREVPNKYNVVVLLMESLSASFMGAFGDPQQATPNMDRLIAEGVLFDRFIASGSRSSNGLIATLCSVPAQLNSPVTHTAMMLDNFRGLPNILQDAGYRTTFIYGGVYDFRNAHGFLKNVGYETIIGEPLDEEIKRRSWGYDDEDMFDRLLHELQQGRDGPQFMTLFTQNLHGRTVPKSYREARGGLKYEKSLKYDKYYNLLDYTDWCVGRFFEKAGKHPFFDNTIFVLTSDHSNHKSPHLYENRHIPLLIYAPWLLQPARHHTVGGQCDVLPTVLGLLGLGTTHASFGRDLLALAAAGDAGETYFTYGQSIGWAQGPWIIQDFFESDETRLFNFVEDPETRTNYGAEHPELMLQMRRKARAQLQLSRILLFENRLYSAPGSPALSSR